MRDYVKVPFKQAETLLSYLRNNGIKCLIVNSLHDDPNTRRVYFTEREMNTL